MYAPAVIDAAQARLEAVYHTAFPRGLTRYPVATCATMTARLAGLWDPEARRPTRRLTPDEDAFVAGERLLGKIDFRYWAERYVFINAAGTGLQRLYPLWETQAIFLGELARLQTSRLASGHPDGLLLNCLKARQGGISTLGAALVTHRVVTQTHVRALLASDVPDNSGSEGLFGMYERIVANLPWWLAPTEKFHQKNQHIIFETGSAILVESGKSMKGGLQDKGGTKGQLGRSKSQPLDEVVLTPSGWVAMGDLHVGDYVVGRNGKPTRITGVYPQGVEQVYRVTFTDGSWTRCSADHLWAVQTGFMKWDRNRWRTQPLRELVNLRLTAGHKGHRYFIPLLSNPAEFSVPASLPIPPYALGLLLGDGGLTVHIAFSTVDEELRQGLERELPVGLMLKHCSRCDYRVVVPPGQSNPWFGALRVLKLFGKKSTAKHIPFEYLTAAPTDRVALLQGLLDTDGWSTKDGRIMFGTSSPQLAEDVRELVALLGGTASLNSYKTARARAYKLQLSLPPSIVPFRLSRKLVRLRKRQRGVYRGIASVVLEGNAPTQCIAVDAPDQLYVTRFGIVTHNTFSTVHLTELSTWEAPEQIDDALMPAVPRSPRTLGIKESTAKGRHNWHHEDWLLGQRGRGRWTNVFIPWFCEPTRYWLPAPVGWVPTEDTLLEARKATLEGPKWLHRPVTLSREQLRWYEETKEAYREKGQLAKFLEEFASDSESCFQASGVSVFTLDQLQYLAKLARPMIDCVAVEPAKDLSAIRVAELASIRQAKELAIAAEQAEREHPSVREVLPSAHLDR